MTHESMCIVQMHVWELPKLFFCKYQLFEFDTNFSLNISLFTAIKTLFKTFEYVFNFTGCFAL